MTSNGTQVMSPHEIEPTRVTPNGTSKEGTKAVQQTTEGPTLPEAKIPVIQSLGPQKTRGPSLMRPNGTLADAKIPTGGAR